MSDESQGGGSASDGLVQALRNIDASGAQPEPVPAQGTDLTGQQQEAPPPPAPAPAARRRRSNRKFFDHTSALKDRLGAERVAIDRARLELSDQMLKATQDRDAAIAKANADFDAAKTDLEDKAEDAIEALAGIDAALNALS